MSANATVDMSDFNTKVKEYLKVARRTAQEAANNICFDVVRFALKLTERADPSEIRQALNTFCRRYPERTVGEILAIMNNRGREFDLDEEVKKVTNKKLGASGYTRSGWIKPMVALAPYIGRNSISAGGVSKNIGPGDASPARSPGTNVEASAWNDVTARTNDSHLTQIKEAGIQAAINLKNADFDIYFQKLAERDSKVF